MPPKLHFHSVQQRCKSATINPRYLDLTVAVLVILHCTWTFSTPLRSGRLLLGLAQDDFYYYLKVAQNLAWFHRAEAFPGISTNGFHPLYFVLLTAVSVFVKTLPGVFRCLWVLDVLSASAIFFTTRRVFASLTSALLANALAVLMTALCSIQICHQMEVTLVLPLGWAFLLTGLVAPECITTRRAALLGMLGALTFLARLDAGLLVLLYIAGFLFNAQYRKTLTREVVGTFCLTLLPLPLMYFWLNEQFFHRLLPVSGGAKQLRHGHAPSLLLFRTFLGVNLYLACGVLLGMLLAYVARNRLSPREKLFVFVSLTDPVLFYGSEMLISDWPVWPWYFYALRFSASGLAVLLCAVAKFPCPTNWFALLLQRSYYNPVVSGLLLASALVKLYRVDYYVDPWMVETQHAAEILNGFAMRHPGAYAMGDRAGMFLFSSSNPVLQAEGLVMDEAFLAHMRAQDDLQSVLSRYGIRYYVAFVPEWNRKQQFSGGCFHAVEPFLAGPMAMHMRSSFCQAPVYQFAGFDGIYVIYSV